MFQAKFVERIKTHFMFIFFFFRKSRRLRDKVKKYGRAGEAVDDNILQLMRIAC
jgi:hypothetical protein